MLNDNVVPFPAKRSPRPTPLTREQLEQLEDMATDLTLTIDNVIEEFNQSEYAHGMIVVLLDSEGQVYTEAVGTPNIMSKIKKLSTWMEAFNDIHNESSEPSELPK